MSKSAGLFNLEQYILDPISSCINNRLVYHRYYDITDKSQLTTNHNGIDIISRQLEVKFENNDPLYISWATIKGWHQYSLCISEKSFCKGVDYYSKEDRFWNEVSGRKLIGFEIYGYKENVITLEETNGRKAIERYYNEPHLLVLQFEEDKFLGIGNFYFERDFVPRLPMGDDVWLLFGNANIVQCIERLALEQLDKN